MSRPHSPARSSRPHLGLDRIEGRGAGASTGDWTKSDFDDLANDLVAAVETASEPWFAAAGLRSEADPSSWFWEFYRGILDFDVEPVWDRVQVPALFLQGAQDPGIPVDETLARIDWEYER